MPLQSRKHYRFLSESEIECDVIHKGGTYILLPIELNNKEITMRFNDETLLKTTAVLRHRRVKAYVPHFYRGSTIVVTY